MDPALSPSRRARPGLTVALLAVAAIVTAAAPASAAEPPPATPFAGALQATTDAVRPANAQATVQRTVAPITERVRATVDATNAVAPVGAVVDTLRRPVEQATAPVRPAVAATTQALGATVAPDSRSPVRDAIGRRPADGRIDRDASTRHGGDSGGGSPLPADVLTAAGTPFQVGVALLAEQARSSASSTSATGDDDNPLDGLPLGPGDGTSLLAGPAGIALLALGLLAALLTLVPRFCIRFLPTPPARWGLAAFLLPIERPG